MYAALLSGEAHVCTWATEEMEAAAGRRLIGIPLREMLTEPQYRPLLSLLDWVRESGWPIELPIVTPRGDAGVLTLRRKAGAIRAEYRPCDERADPSESRVPVDLRQETRALV